MLSLIDAIRATGASAHGALFRQIITELERLQAIVDELPNLVHVYAVMKDDGRNVWFVGIGFKSECGVWEECLDVIHAEECADNLREGFRDLAAADAAEGGE